MLRLALVSALSLACVTVTHAFDNGQYKDVPDHIRSWFKSLKSPGGGLCCDSADGVRIEDPDWKRGEGETYLVFARDKWNQIPPDRVLHPTDRKVGYAILWWPPYQERPSCFLPGAEN